jgi:hypothetical protein
VGSLVRGTLVGMDIPNNSITLRTSSGDHTVPLGTAPIYVNGVRGSTRNLRVGQVIQVERTLPTEASQTYVTQMVRVLPAQSVNAQTGAAGSSAVRSRTRARGAPTARSGTAGPSAVPRSARGAPGLRPSGRRCGRASRSSRSSPSPARRWLNSRQPWWLTAFDACRPERQRRRRFRRLQQEPWSRLSSPVPFWLTPVQPPLLPMAPLRCPGRRSCRREQLWSHPAR